MIINQHNYLKVMALVPVYDKHGSNVTEIMFKGQPSAIANYRTETVLKQMARLLAVDLVQLRQNYGPLVKRKRMIPLILRSNVWLAPLYIRKAVRVNNDGSIGYVAYDHIECYMPHQEDQDKMSVITFVDGQQLVVHQKTETICQSLQITQMIGRVAF